MVETLKDYTIKALINTVDHLGSMAEKVNNFVDEKIVEVAGVDLKICCIQQVLPQLTFLLFQPKKKKLIFWICFLAILEAEIMSIFHWSQRFVPTIIGIKFSKAS